MLWIRIVPTGLRGGRVGVFQADVSKPEVSKPVAKPEAIRNSQLPAVAAAHGEVVHLGGEGGGLAHAVVFALQHMVVPIRQPRPAQSIASADNAVSDLAKRDDAGVFVFVVRGPKPSRARSTT